MNINEIIRKILKEKFLPQFKEIVSEKMIMQVINEIDFDEVNFECELYPYKEFDGYYWNNDLKSLISQVLDIFLIQIGRKFSNKFRNKYPCLKSEQSIDKFISIESSAKSLENKIKKILNKHRFETQDLTEEEANRITEILKKLSKFYKDHKDVENAIKFYFFQLNKEDREFLFDFTKCNEKNIEFIAKYFIKEKYTNKGIKLEDSIKFVKETITELKEYAELPDKIDQQYLKTLEGRIKDAVLDCGRSATIEQFQENCEKRDKHYKNLKEYSRRFGKYPSYRYIYSFNDFEENLIFYNKHHSEEYALLNCDKCGSMIVKLKRKDHDLVGCFKCRKPFTQRTLYELKKKNVRKELEEQKKAIETANEEIKFEKKPK